jgi:sec-independent protein translocase protein TatC
MPRRLSYGEEATLVEHLEELRHRIFIILGALVLTTILAFVFHTHIIHWLNQPLPADRRRPVTLGVAEPFVVSVTLSVYAGFILALPIVLWQLWLFFAPAFEKGIERRVLGLVAMATALGAGGLAFGYFVLLPRAVHWLTSYDNKQFNNLVQAKPYYAFVSTVLLGVLTSKTLRKNRRIGYFVTAVIALGLPGPDPVTTGLELLPMWVLFETSIWLAVYVEHRAASRLVAPGVSGS